jgi:hypothetical protein
MARAADPAVATSQRDRWIGVALWTCLIVAAVSVLFRGQWLWYVLGAIDLLVAVPSLVRCLRSLARRSPLAGSARQHQVNSSAAR